MDDLTQGSSANYTGSNLEMFIANTLTTLGYTHVPSKDFFDIAQTGNHIYSRQFNLGLSIYDTKLVTDFILYHPQKWSNYLVIESKWQQSSGSVDEKYPYLVLNLKHQIKYPSIIILDGAGYKPGAEAWLRNQVDSKLLHVFNMRDFQIWANKGNI